MTNDQLNLLREKLSTVFVPYLPPLLDQNKPADHLRQKNISRAFSAFAIQKISRIDTVSAAQAVVDDYEDNGLDAIHYHQASKRLFLVQAKLKADEPFQLAEAQAFVTGVKDLVYVNYDRFNKNVEDRRTELDLAIDEADEIVLVVAHTGEIVSEHAKDLLDRFLTDEDKPDERIRNEWVDFGPDQVLGELLSEQAVSLVNDELVMFGHQKIEGPRITYYGQVSVNALADLYKKHGNSLLEKNIRYLLDIRSSDVNRAIQSTLVSAPGDFFHLNNGVTAIAHNIQPRGPRDSGRRFTVEGLSIINGAQTVASTHHLIVAHPELDISSARVMLTLIQVDPNDRFSTNVTRARNFQNPVSIAHFAALDDVQERLRRELAFNNIVYRYRPEARGATPGLETISIYEASISLALLHPDPGTPAKIKREPAKFLDSASPEYRGLFTQDLSGRKLANAVRLFRRGSESLASNERAARGLEKLIYRHGRHVILWLTLHANSEWFQLQEFISDTEAGNLLSTPLDAWRERVRAEVTPRFTMGEKGPLAFFRNLTDSRPLVTKLRDEGLIVTHDAE